MAKTKISAGLNLRLPGRVKTGSNAFYRRGALKSARASMQDVVQNYAKLVRHLKGITPDALRNALDPVFLKSQIYVPVSTGTLKETGQIRVEGVGDTLEGSITYGDARAWYAAIVHEYVWLNHESPTRAKYLQAAMEEELDSFMVSLTVDYATALGMR